MKKLIAILTIAIVLVGAVFATGTTTNSRITVTTTVGASEPTIILKAGTTSTLDKTATVTTNAAGNHDGEGLTATQDISAANVLIYCGLYQTSKANTQKKYSFEVTATQFVQVKDSKKAAVAAADAYTVNQNVTFKTLSATGWFTTNTTGVNAITAPSINDGEKFTADVTFDGLGPVNATVGENAISTSNAKELATFQIEWTKDEAAPAGEYQADITLAITVE